MKSGILIASVLFILNVFAKKVSLQQGPNLSVCNQTTYLLGPGTNAYYKSACYVLVPMTMQQSTEFCLQNGMKLIEDMEFTFMDFGQVGKFKDICTEVSTADFNLNLMCHVDENSSFYTNRSILRDYSNGDCKPENGYFSLACPNSYGECLNVNNLCFYGGCIDYQWHDCTTYKAQFVCEYSDAAYLPNTTTTSTTTTTTTTLPTSTTTTSTNTTLPPTTTTKALSKKREKSKNKKKCFEVKNLPSEN